MFFFNNLITLSLIAFIKFTSEYSGSAFQYIVVESKRKQKYL